MGAPSLIDWKGHCRIAGADFVYTDRDTARTTAVIGYLTGQVAND
jgi:hypothetical protein